MTELLLFAAANRIEGLRCRARALSAKQLELLELAGKMLWRGGFTGRDGRRLGNPLKRFASKIEIDNETLCWNWIGSMQTNGYAAFPHAGVRHLAHRWIFATLKGPIPEGLVIDHLCRNKRCVNIAHLEAVTQSVNVKRSVGIPIEIPSFLLPHNERSIP